MTKLIQMLISFGKKAWEILTKIFRELKAKAANEIEDLKARVKTVTPKNVLRHSLGSVSHFFVTALATVGLKKTPAAPLLEYVSLPFGDCITCSEESLTIRPIRFGFRCLERIYNSLIYDSTYFNYFNSVNLRI